jgi:hypothetical protein
LSKHKAVKLEDSGRDASRSGGTRKRAQTNVEDDVLSRPEAAELLRTVIMELEVIDHSMAKIREAMAAFAASVNSKSGSWSTPPLPDMGPVDFFLFF